MGAELALDCLCVWSDLLGFGRAFEEGGWSLDSEKVRQAAARVRNIEELIFRSNSPTMEYVLLLNDGIARNVDLTSIENGPAPIVWWLQSTLTNHWQVNAVEHQWSQPGIRSVLCFGQRMDVRESHKTSLSQLMAPANLKEALERDISVYSPRQFQMNLAFSKAYLVESLGKKSGIAGANFYIEGGIFSVLSRLLDNEHGSKSGAWTGWRCHTRMGDEVIVFTICAERNGGIVARLVIEVAARGARVEHRGILADFHRVLRFQPMDEGDNFWFDFTRYESQKGDGGN